MLCAPKVNNGLVTESENDTVSASGACTAAILSEVGNKKFGMDFFCHH